MKKKTARARYAQILTQLARPALTKPVEALTQELRALAAVLFLEPKVA